MRAAPYSDTSDDLFGADAFEDPQQLYARLRRERPISRVDESGVHLVATWDLIDEVLHRESDFSANLTGVLVRDEDGRATTFSFPGGAASQVIATADEPHHAIHRALVQPALAAGRIGSLEPRIHAWTQEALTPWIADGGGDFVPISEVIPARAIAHVLGLPDRDVVRHRTWAMMGGDLLAGALSEEQLLALMTETGQLAAYLGVHLDSFAAAEQGDGAAPMLAALEAGIERGEIAREQAIGIAIVMFGAGGESTAALIGSAVRRLAEDPATAETLRRAPHLIPRFVEEVARLEPPFKFHYRAVRSACDLGGVELMPGDRLMLLWASANRDPSQFEDPDTLRLDRRHPKQHMSFGRGSHFCIGASLARLEVRIVLEQLLASTKRISSSTHDAAVHAPSIFVRRLARLPLAIVAA